MKCCCFSLAYDTFGEVVVWTCLWVRSGLTPTVVDWIVLMGPMPFFAPSIVRSRFPLVLVTLIWSPAFV